MNNKGCPDEHLLRRADMSKPKHITVIHNFGEQLRWRDSIDSEEASLASADL
jgi:hypothetical protein